MVHLSSSGPQHVLVPMSFTPLLWGGTSWLKLPSGLWNHEISGCVSTGTAVLSRGKAWLCCSHWWIMQRDWSQSIPFPVIYVHSDTLTHGRVNTLTLFHCGEMLLIWDFFSLWRSPVFGKDIYTNLSFLFFFFPAQILQRLWNQLQK